MKTVDTRGQLCPAPLIATKRALKETTEGGTFEVITDNKTSLGNLKRFLNDNGTEFSVSDDHGTWRLLIKKTGPLKKTLQPEEYCVTDIPHLSRGNFMVAFTSDIMGEGDKELGRILIVNFIKAIKDLEELPSRMVFYNRGVFLACTGSPAKDYLKDLEKMGVGIFLCATCISYYGLESKVETGVLSNMFEIAQWMASASNIIKP